eukprot:1408858-Ditylum_brightwellii.AAC.1
MRSKAECYDFFHILMEKISAPNEVVVDGAKEQTLHDSHFQKTLYWLRFSACVLEAYSPLQNCADVTILLPSKHWKNRMATKNRSSNAPALERVVEWAMSTSQSHVCPTYLPTQTVLGLCRTYIDHNW